MSPQSSRTDKIMALIPAYNEEGSISQVVNGVHENLPEADIVVINDCSTDDTINVARESGANVVSLPCNLGIGGAVQTGFKFAREHQYDIVVRLDGDGQHDPAEIPHLLKKITTRQVDAVFGSRFIGKDSDMKIPIGRKIGIKTFAIIVSLLTRQKATDTTSGFMCLNKYAIAVLAEYLPQDYPEVEGRIILHKAGLLTLELPVYMRSRFAGNSSINSWKSIYYAVKVSIAALIGAMKDIPVVHKENENEQHSTYSTPRGYHRQPFAVSGDGPTDSEAQIT